MPRRLALILALPFVLAWAAASYVSVNIARDNLIRLGEIQNVVLVKVFRNSVWPDIRDAFQQNAGQPRAAIRSGPSFDRIDAAVRRFADKSGVLKVKLYSIDGRTVYSSENRQIGEDKSENEGFQRALKGEAPSELAFRDSFSSFERETSKLNLLSTYVAVENQDGKPEAVLEVYVDANDIVDRLNRSQFAKSGLIGLCFLLLYGATLFAYARAGRRDGSKD